MLRTEVLNKHFRVGKKTLYAVNQVSLSIQKGEALGLIGESGSGKSTLGKAILRLTEPTSGTVYFENENICQLTRNEMKSLRRRMQIIFQDPYGSLNPRMSIENCIGEGLDIHHLFKGTTRQEKIAELLQKVELDASMMWRFPSQLSGGQRQRVGIARALAVDPQFIVCDEPVSALDLATQIQILELLSKLKQEKELTYLFITHDLRALQEIADSIAVMYLGHIVELGKRNDVIENPAHPYTQALFSAVPALKKPVKRIILKGENPSPFAQLQGCPFQSRCPYVMPKCRMEKPPLHETAPHHFAACHLK